MELKKQLFGYDKSNVENEISSYKVKLDKANDEINSLKTKLDESKLEILKTKTETERISAQYQRQIYEMEYKLKDINEKYQNTLKDLKDNNKRVDGISQIYYYAYNNAAKIAKSAYKSSKELVDGTVNNINGAKKDTEIILDELKIDELQIKQLFADIIENIKKMDSKMEGFTNKSEKIKKSLTITEDISKGIYSRFDNIMNEFESSTKYLISEQSKNELINNNNIKEEKIFDEIKIPNEEKIQFEEPKKEITKNNLAFEQNFVPILEEQKQNIQDKLIENQKEEKEENQLNKRLNVKDLLKKYSQLS